MPDDPFRSDLVYSPYFDTLIAEGSELLDERATFERNVLLNGSEVPRKLFPQLRGVQPKEDARNGQTVGVGNTI